MAEKLIRDALMLFATIDPIGTLSIFLAVTAKSPLEQKRRIAIKAIAFSACILLGFIVIGQAILTGMNIRLESFQIAGGLILFLFGLQMIFSNDAPEERDTPEAGHDVAVFPLAVPSIASPGAVMAVVLLTDNETYSFWEQLGTACVLFGVLLFTLGLLLAANPIHRLIGRNGASILVRVMGMILAALAVETVIEGVTVAIAAHARV